MTFSVVPMMGFDLAGDGVALTGSGENKSVLLFADSAGSQTRWLLKANRMRPGIEPDNPTWKFLTQYWLAVGGDTAYITTTLSDSIWSVPLDDDTVLSSAIRVPGYLPPTPAHEMPKGAKALIEWQKTFHIAAKVIATRDVVAVPFVQGVLNYGDPMILALRQRGRSWVALTGAPPIIQARGDTLIALLHPQEDATTLGLFVPSDK